MIVDNYKVENLWVEPGLGDNTDGDPFEVSDALELQTNPQTIGGIGFLIAGGRIAFIG